MPLSLRRGRVTSITERQVGLVRLEVDGRACVAYPRLTGPLAAGDDVLVNTQAVDLALDSGGFDVLYANLTRGLDLPAEAAAHVMKLPYTPLQFAASHAEEGDGAPAGLSGLPVICCMLHSQVAPACAGIGPGRRVAYLQLPGGALPVSLSDALRALGRAGLVETTVAVGACVDGDIACVSVAAALAWAAGRGFDACVCSVGPGIVGTGTFLGHGALAAAEGLNATSALGGFPVLAPRVSTADERERHRGLSHHTLAVLGLVLGSVTVAWPVDLPISGRPSSAVEVEVAGWREECAGLPLESMGRGLDDDPWLFAAAFAAGKLVRGRLG